MKWVQYPSKNVQVYCLQEMRPLYICIHTYTAGLNLWTEWFRMGGNIHGAWKHHKCFWLQYIAFHYEITQFVTRVLEWSISTPGQKGDNALFWFSLLRCIISTHLQSRRFQNVFCSKSHLNCSWFPKFKSSFLKIVADRYSSLRYSGDNMSNPTRWYYNLLWHLHLCVVSAHGHHKCSWGNSHKSHTQI
jgi:hypothetical protein